jgi:hypothetical protein
LQEQYFINKIYAFNTVIFILRFALQNVLKFSHFNPLQSPAMNITEMLGNNFTFAILTFINVWNSITGFAILNSSNEIHTLTHNQTESFLEPLIEFNLANCSFTPKENSCTLVHPKSKKQLQLESRKVGKYYLFDATNHTISTKDYFGSSGEGKCRMVMALASKENAGTFIEEVAETFCLLEFCSELYPKDSRFHECMNRLISKKIQSKYRIDTSKTFEN